MLGLCQSAASSSCRPPYPATAASSSAPPPRCARSWTRGESNNPRVFLQPRQFAVQQRPWCNQIESRSRDHRDRRRETMNSLILAAIVFAVVFAGGVIGLRLQRALPESYTTGGPRDMIGAVSGLLTLLLALVLGLLIWTAFGVYSTQKGS